MSRWYLDTSAALKLLVEESESDELAATIDTQGLELVASLLAGAHLRSLDALYIAAAIRIGVDGVLTYDLRMQVAARERGISFSAPA